MWNVIIFTEVKWCLLTESLSVSLEMIKLWKEWFFLFSTRDDISVLIFLESVLQKIAHDFLDVMLSNLNHYESYLLFLACESLTRTFFLFFGDLLKSWMLVWAWTLWLWTNAFFGWWISFLTILALYCCGGEYMSNSGKGGGGGGAWYFPRRLFSSPS